MKSHRIDLAVLFIFVLAAVLRFYKLGEVPSSVNADEAAIGYNAYSIIKTGKDEYGEYFPLSFRSFDDYKAPLYIYLTSFSVAVFGLNDFSVRFISALSGTLTVVLTYYLVRSLLLVGVSTGLRDSSRMHSDVYIQAVSTVSAFLLAISPWHLQFSRSAYEANLSVFFIVLGILLFYRGFDKPILLDLSGIPLVLSMWTYHTPRIFVPLLISCVVLLHWKEMFERKMQMLLSMILSLIVFVPLAAVLLSPAGLVRVKGISSLNNPEIVQQSIHWIEYDHGGFIATLIHNRRIEYAREIIKGYMVHFDPAFLFLERAQSKYRAPGMGLMYLWEFPFLLVGSYEIVRRRGKWSILLILWVFLSPVAASVTLWLPSAVRTIVMLPAVQIVTAFGIVSMLRLLRRKWVAMFYLGSILMTCTALVNLFYYLHQYYVHMPIDFAQDWQYGRKLVVSEVVKREDYYDKVVVSTSLDQPQIFFLYYLRYSPTAYLSEGGTTSGKFDTESNHFGKYIFKTIAKFEPQKNQKILYVTPPNEVPVSAKMLSQIKYPDGSDAFILFEM